MQQYYYEKKDEHGFNIGYTVWKPCLLTRDECFEGGFRLVGGTNEN